EFRRVLFRSLKSCGRPTLSPDGSRFAVACSGAMNTDGEIDALDQSALVLFDAKKRPLREVARYTAEDIAGEPIQGRVAFASEELVLLSTHTAYEIGRASCRESGRDA